VFNSILGWENSATYGSVISYNLYWLAVILGFLAMGFNEKRGHWPWRRKAKEATNRESESGSGSISDDIIPTPDKPVVSVQQRDESIAEA
jgi:high-affinity iron transporter